MKIISEQKDYYDCVQSQGQDQSIVYKRFPKEEVFPSTSAEAGKVPGYLFESYRIYNSRDVLVYSKTIGFCGKIYPFISLCFPETLIGSSRYPDVGKEIICFTLDQVEEFFKRNLKLKEYQDWQSTKSTRGNPFWNCQRDSFKRYFEFFDKEKEQPSEITKKFFKENPDPIFVSYRRKNSGYKYEIILVRNSILKHLEFFRLFDPYQAFQEINMWVNNQAMPEKVIPSIDNETMRDIKGFDKFSFRKDKSK